MVFLLTMAYYSLNNMVCSIVGEALGMHTGAAFMRLNQVRIVCYESLEPFLLALTHLSVNIPLETRQATHNRIEGEELDSQRIKVENY